MNIIKSVFTIGSGVGLLTGIGAAEFAHASAEIGKLAVVNGDVRIAKSAEANGDKGRAVMPGDAIANNDVIKTGDNSSAKLLFTDQSVIDLGGNAAFKVSDYELKDTENRRGTFSLFYGKVRALVTKKVGAQGNVEFRSGQTVMGVRGTEFVVDTPRSSGGISLPTSVTVVSGLVAVRPPGATSSVSVGAGQVCVTNSSSSSSGGGGTGGGGASGGAQVSQASPEQIQAAVSSTKAADNTFISAVQVTGGSSSSSGGSGNTAATGALASIGKLVASSVAVPPPASESGTALPKNAPSILSAPQLLPPSVPPPGGSRVHLSVRIQ